MGRITPQTANSMFQDLVPFGNFDINTLTNTVIGRNGENYFEFEDEESTQENFYNFLQTLEREKEFFIENSKFEFKGHIVSIMNMIKNYHIPDKVNLYDQNETLEKIGSTYGVPVYLITVRQNRYKIIDVNGFLLGEGPNKSITLSKTFKTLETIVNFEQEKPPKKPDVKIYWRKDVPEGLTKDWGILLGMYDRFLKSRFFEMIEDLCSNYVDIRKDSYGKYFLINLDRNEVIFEGSINLKETAKLFLREFMQFQQSLKKTVVENTTRSDIEELRTDKRIIEEMIDDFKRSYGVCVSLSFERNKSKLKLIEK
ncbi:MAG: hypothetical protein K9H48_21285 [Melioribacteraceae bacterium]|nr:hypothetical protein [Melioribacteraceae bacterium]